MQFMPHSRSGGSSWRHNSETEEPCCPPTPVIRPIPLLQEPPTIRLPECPISSSARLESCSPNKLGHSASSKKVYQLPADDEQPTWVVDFMKRAGNSSNSMKGSPNFGLKKKQNSFSNLIWKFLSNTKKSKARGGYKRV